MAIPGPSSRDSAPFPDRIWEDNREVPPLGHLPPPFSHRSQFQLRSPMRYPLFPQGQELFRPLFYSIPISTVSGPHNLDSALPPWCPIKIYRVHRHSTN